MLQDIIDETIETIRVGLRADGSLYPMQSQNAARQVLATHRLASPNVQQRLFFEMIRLQDSRGILRDVQQLVNTSLVNFVGKAAEKEMGEEYERLKQIRFDATSSLESRYAE